MPGSLIHSVLGFTGSQVICVIGQTAGEIWNNSVYYSFSYSSAAREHLRPCGGTGVVCSVGGALSPGSQE